MRLPYAQVAMEVLEVSAPELSIDLGITEAEAGWALVKLIPWALARCPDHEPPSENDVVEGPHAAQLIARAIGFSGDPEAFVDAGARLRFPIFERVTLGIRIRGLDRYDSAWGSNHRPQWKEWQEFRAGIGKRPGSRRNPTVKTKGKRGPDADADADAKKLLTEPPAGFGSGEADDRDEGRWWDVAEQLAAWMVCQRDLSGKFEKTSAKDLGQLTDWAFDWALKEQPSDQQLGQMRAAWLKYLDDPFAVERGARLPLWCSENVGLHRWTAERVAGAEERAS